MNTIMFEYKIWSMLLELELIKLITRYKYLNE